MLFKPRSATVAIALSLVLLLPGSASVPMTVVAGAQPATPANGVVCGNPIPDVGQLPSTLAAGYDVVGTYPHDPSAFVEGLVWYDNGFFESTGLEGHSSVRRVEFPSGAVLNKLDLSPDLFGEGLALVDTHLIQLTWQSHIGFVYDRDSLSRTDTFAYPREGWGLTYDGTNLIASDGSDTLSLLDPSTRQTVGTLQVTMAGCPVRNLNELEWIDGEIWANVWLTDVIVRIDPASGNVLAYLDMSNLRDPAALSNRDAVLNGIAFDPDQHRIFITGKLWSTLYEIRLRSGGRGSSASQASGVGLRFERSMLIAASSALSRSRGEVPICTYVCAPTSSARPPQSARRPSPTTTPARCSAWIC